jgi:GAF domain-containing protein
VTTTQQDDALIDETDRLERLHASGLLEPTTTEAFDRITRLARSMLGVESAMVTLIDRDRQFFKSSAGLTGPLAEERGSTLDRSFCKMAVASGQRFLVEDARSDPLVRHSPAVTEDGIEAYAGQPLRISTGHIFGTLCVMQKSQRQWTESELEVLADLAALTVDEIEYQLKLRELAGLETLADRLPSAVSQLAGAVRSTATLADTPQDPRLPRLAEVARQRMAIVETLTNDLQETATSTRARQPSKAGIDLAALVRRTCALVGSGALPDDLVVHAGDRPVLVDWRGPDLGQALSLVVIAALHHLGSGRRVEVDVRVADNQARARIVSPGHLMPTGDLLRAVSGFSTVEGASRVTSRNRRTTVTNGPLTATASESGTEFLLALALAPSTGATTGGSGGVG